MMSCPEGKEQETGYKHEPWHYRFIGVNAAQEAHSLNLSLQEYLRTKPQNYK